MEQLHGHSIARILEGMLPSRNKRVALRETIRGFTLVELMVVVTITGILATLGFVSMSRQSSAAKRIEPLTMIENIRVAQERWRSTHMMYLNVTDDSAWYPRNAALVGNRNKVWHFYLPAGASHSDNVYWLALRPVAATPVQFGYITKAGNSGTAFPAPVSSGFSGYEWPTPTENWYTVEAFGDVDWDGTMSSYLASSYGRNVAAFQDGE